MSKKVYTDRSVLEASRQRVSEVFDNFEKIYISFSGWKDSSVMTHLVLAEAKKRWVKVWLLIIDLEAQYYDTITHIEQMVEMYKDNIDLHWFCWQLLLRNAVSNFSPRWVCWDETKEDIWVRPKPIYESDLSQYDFYQPKMEFEEFMVLFWEWYSQNWLYKTAWFIWIRSDESLHRYRAITSEKKWLMFNNRKWTTKISKNLFNIYPIYDWKTSDIWVFHWKFKELPHNKVYDKMLRAWVPLWDQRLCQPYWDDQRKWLWLYHILEPETWYKLIARVSWVNSGALYIQERWNITGYHNITKPEWHTWESFCNLLLKTMPRKTHLHYRERFVKFFVWWKKRWYTTIPDEAPHDLEVKCWAPSWKRLCKVLLRNDHWCKSLWQTQPKSDAYLKFKEIKAKREIANKIW